MERTQLLNDLKAVASHRELEDTEEQLLQNKMKDCVQEMTDATSDSDLLLSLIHI